MLNSLIPAVMVSMPTKGGLNHFFCCYVLPYHQILALILNICPF